MKMRLIPFDHVVWTLRGKKPTDLVLVSKEHIELIMDITDESERYLYLINVRGTSVRVSKETLEPPNNTFHLHLIEYIDE